jgi:hypothetical protein
MLVQKVAHKSFNVLGLVILLISINQQQAPTIVEAQNSGWSTPQTIPGYDPGTWPPILVADQDRTVHAFSSQPVQVGEGESAQAISYNRWTLEQGWTLPTDIILSPYKDARITDARLDRHGVFHVVFFGGDNTGANIYYSKAPAANANDSQAWSVPIIIGENAGDPAAAVSFEGDPGTLYVIFSGRQPQHGLYVANSKDDARTGRSQLQYSLPQVINPISTTLRSLEVNQGGCMLFGAFMMSEAKGGASITQGRRMEMNGVSPPCWQLHQKVWGHKSQHSSSTITRSFPYSLCHPKSQCDVRLIMGRRGTIRQLFSLVM